MGVKVGYVLTFSPDIMANAMSDDFEKVSSVDLKEVDVLKTRLVDLTRERDDLLKQLAQFRTREQNMEASLADLFKRLDAMEAMIIEALEAD